MHPHQWFKITSNRLEGSFKFQRSCDAQETLFSSKKLARTCNLAVRKYNLLFISIEIDFLNSIFEKLNKLDKIIFLQFFSNKPPNRIKQNIKLPIQCFTESIRKKLYGRF